MTTNRAARQPPGSNNVFLLATQFCSAHLAVQKQAVRSRTKFSVAHLYGWEKKLLMLRPGSADRPVGQVR